MIGCGSTSTVQPDAGISDPGPPDTSVMDTSVPDSMMMMDAGMDAPVDTGPTHAFVANYNNGSGGSLKVFDTPLLPDGGSTASLTLSGANGLGAPASIRLDPLGKKIWIADQSKKVLAFDLPLSTNSMPSTTLTPKNIPTDLQFDTNGNLWVSEFAGVCERWNSPPSGNSAITVTNGATNVFAIAIDGQGNLYGGGPGTSGVWIWSSPQTMNAMPTITNNKFAASISGLAVGNGKLYVTSYQNGAIASYDLPMTAQSTPATIFGSTHYGWRMSFSPANELIVPGVPNDSITFYAPTAYNMPALTLTKGLADPRGVAFGN
jgi:hypothetical protein